MPISPMISTDSEKGLSQETEGEAWSTSVVNYTGTEEEEEGRKAVARREVVGPTKKEREEHEATLCLYRSWCRHCVRGRGRNSPHFKKKEEDTDTDAKEARIAMDYFSMSVEEEKHPAIPSL